MSVSSMDAVLQRIKLAEPESPIAVFRCIHSVRQFDAVFAGTVHTQRLIRMRDTNFVGIYDKTTDQSRIIEEMQIIN